MGLKSHVLCQLGHEHVVVAPGARDSEESSDEQAEGGGRLARSKASARVIRVGGPASPYDPTYHLLLRFDKIAGIVERERPDVLEVHSPYLAALGVMRAKRAHYGVRTFQWHSDFIDTYAGVLEARLAHDVPMLPARVWSRVIGPDSRATRPLWGLVRSIARRCDATLVAAQWQVDKLVSHRVPRVVRVPFGIERSVFRADARSYEGRRELLALASHDTRRDDAVILVGVGRFAVEKRWDVVIDAFLRIRARDPRRDMVLVLIGDGPERERMTARAAGSPDIVMPGFVKGRDALARMLASADALVHGCPFETFGLSIAEAMSCALPVVVPDEGGACEMYVPEAGERYRALDVEACAEATERLLARLATDADAVRAAASAAAARLPNVVEQFEGQVALYQDLLARRGVRRGATDRGL
jgi:alpha-1,6-mannosyltransferase